MRSLLTPRQRPLCQKFWYESYLKFLALHFIHQVSKPKSNGCLKISLLFRAWRLLAVVAAISSNPNSSFLGTLAIRLTPMPTSWQRRLPSRPKFLLPHARNADITSQSFNKALMGLDTDSMCVVLTRHVVTQQTDQTSVSNNVADSDDKRNRKKSKQRCSTMSNVL